MGPTSSTSRPGCQTGLQGSFRLNGSALGYRTELIKQANDFLLKLQAESKQDAEVKAAAELKAKQDAEAKAAADKVIAKLKTRTIRCNKGKLIKMITAINPKCPAGYKQK